MRAEHRKEAQANTLKQTLGQAVQGLREGPSRSTVVVVVILVVAVGLYFIWHHFAESARESDSTRWVQWDDLATPTQAEQFAREKDVEGTTQGRLTDFLLARRSLAEGVQDLGATGLPRTQALENIRRAAQDYDKLADTSAERPLLQQEALLGAGEAYEALGEYDTAQQKYQALVEKYPDSIRGRTAAQRLEWLKGSSPEDRRDREALKKEYSKPPATPGAPPLP
jgi:tetratricopeptide (TPR) repeat protein